MAVNALLQGLLGDAAVESHFTADAEIAAMLRVEAALALAQAAEGVIPQDAAAAIAAACAEFAPDRAALAEGVARDGVVVPDLVGQLRAYVGAPHGVHVHKGATSQDVIDTALVLRLAPLLDDLAARLAGLIATLDARSAADGATPLMGRTRMQRARPIDAALKIAAWRDPLARHLTRLDELRPRLLALQFGGAVGNRAELGAKADAVADRLADALGLKRAPRAWHAQRDAIVECGQWFALVSGSCGKIGADVALMALNEIGEVRLSDGGGSSAMPEKSNPVAAEILVTLARCAAALAGGLAQSLVHENERSGAAWTLEWLFLPPLAVAAGASLRQSRAVMEALSFRVT
jgi:3-carboxy-cis,cis-muconate cycloisomerase